MTDSNAEPASVPPTSTTGAHRLRRRATDRVAAGVASGLADYLNIDPLLVRVVLVGLVLFNGAGFFIYLAAWLFIPVEGSDASIVEGWIRRLGASAGTAGTIAWVALAIIGTLLLLDSFQTGDGRLTIGPVEGFVVALVVIAGGVLLVRRSASGDTSGVTHQIAAEQGPAAAPPAHVAQIRAERSRRDSSPLGLYVLGLTLLALGTLAAIDGTTAVEILPGHYAGAALAIIGLGLLAGAWWGRARMLIIIGVLIVPVAIAFSFVAVPLDAGWGDRRATPTHAADVLDEYRLSGGRLTLDLTGLPRSTAELRIAASVGMGRLLVILPEGARAEVTSEVGAGTSELFGELREGTGLTYQDSHEGTGGGFVLDLEAGLGSVEVRTASGQE